MRLTRLLKSPLAVAASAFGLLGLLTLWPADRSATDAATGSLSLLRLGLALGGILALVMAAIPALRRLQASGAQRGRRLRCEEVLALDSRHRVALLRVDGRELLLSLQTDGTQLLLDLGAAEGAPESFPAALRKAQGA